MENKNERLADKIQENTNEVRSREKIESNNKGPTVDNAIKVRKSSTVSSCEQTRSNAMSPTSTRVNKTEKDEKDLDKRTTSVGSKSLDKVASNHKPKGICNGITSLESKGDSTCGPVDGTGPKGSGIVSDKTVHQYDKTHCGLERKLKET